MAADGAAMIAAAVRAACLAKAPRRTVQAVAAAVAGVFAQHAEGAGARNRVRVQPAAQTAEDSGVSEVTPDALVEALRTMRRAQRQRKKERRRASKVAAQCDEGEGRAGPELGSQKPDIPPTEVSTVPLTTDNVAQVTVQTPDAERSLARQIGSGAWQGSRHSQATSQADEISFHTYGGSMVDEQAAAASAPPPPDRPERDRSPRRRGGGM